MDIYDSVINIAIIIGFNCISFYFGYRTAKSKFILTHLFAHLEREDHIRTKLDADGEKNLIRISQVVAEALEEDRASRSQK